ncbi:MAG: TolC family protein [Pirellulaceae bacterium]
MAQLIARHHYTVLTLLVFLAGCAMPNARSEPTPAVAVTNPSRALPASVFESESHTSPVTAVSQAAYESPAVAPPEPQVAADGPAPLPARVLPDRLQPALATQEAFESSAESLQSTYLADDPADPFSGQAELSVEQLVAAVQARNPSLQAAWAAWHAAAERYPQVVSFDDPMFTGMISPQGIGMDDGGGWMVQASQQVPWAGKRALRGSAAAAEAEAMRGDIADTRLRLAEAARTAFYDYYLARRQTEVNASTQRLLEQFREIARNKYQVNQATEQDILQADVELASLESRRTELARDEQIAMARINTLLHRAAHHALPPPPAETPLPETPPAVDALQQAAVHSRPDLFAQQARIRTERANVALACKEYYPDVNLVAKYDGFMPEEMRPQVGIDVNVPLRYARRSAAEREAADRLQQRCAEYQDLLDQTRYEVQSAFDRTTQTEQVVHLFEEKILPAAQRSLDSALANYTSGNLDFLRLLDAERQLNTQREMYYQAIAEYHRRVAELARVVGEPSAATP